MVLTAQPTGLTGFEPSLGGNVHSARYELYPTSVGLDQKIPPELRLFTATILMLRGIRRRTDWQRLKIGLRMLRIDRQYGDGAIRTLADAASVSQSSLYEYEVVARFLLFWLGFTRYRHVYEEHGYLSYSHLREAIRLRSYVQTVEALKAIRDGDVNYPQFDNLPMTVGTFKEYVGLLRGIPRQVSLLKVSGQVQDIKKDTVQRLSTILDELSPGTSVKIMAFALESRGHPSIRSDVQIEIGSHVVLRLDGEQTRYTLGHSGSGNPAEGIISQDSPLGAAILGRRPGEIVRVQAPEGSIEVEIVECQ